MGFTTEHPLHRYVRRVLVLDQLLGSWKVLTRELGNAVIASRTLPPLPPL
jgi:alkylation response protein AidB-like acyl-CoA dehydrogenase